MTQKDDTSFVELFQAHPIPMWVYDLDTLKFIAVNTAAISHYGYTEAEFLGMTITAIRPPADVPKLLQNLATAPATGLEKSGLWTHLKKDGSLIDVEITSHPLSFNEQQCKFVLAHDVTERHSAQKKIARLSRISAVLSGINSAIVRIRDRDALFQEACRIAATEGAFVSAQIGLIDPETMDIHIVASSGGEACTIAHAARTDTPDSDFPACRAVRQMQPVICNDIRTDPALAPLSEHFAERGHLALAAFPLIVEQRPVAVLVLFAAVVDYFDEEERKLLDELAGDISFALEYIEREEQRKRGAARLLESEAGLRRAQLMNKIAHVITGPAGEFESWSETLPQLIGTDDAGIPPDTRRWLDIVHQADRAKFRNVCIDAGKCGTRKEVEYRMWHADGALIQLRQVLEPLRGATTPDGKMRWFNTIQDITEQTAQLRRIARLSRLYAVLSGINSAIVRIHDRNALFQEACRVAVHHGAFSMAWIGVIDPDTLDGEVVAWCGGDANYIDHIRLTARAGTPDSVRPACVAVREMRPVICNNVQTDTSLATLGTILLANGHHSAGAWPMKTGNRVGAVIALFAPEVDFFDEEQIKLIEELVGDLSFGLQFIDKEEKLSFLAYYDVLTGLPNATLFHDRLTQFLHGARHDHNITAVIMIDLQHFVHLNNAMGRHAGDAVLREVAKRLNAVLREPYSLARIGGDTFAVAVTGLHHGTDVMPILEQQMFESFNRPFTMDGEEIRIAVRAGLALFPEDGEDAETLFRHAEVALKKAKSSGERYLYYAPQMNAAIAARLVLENELRVALEARQFVMHYQPRVDLMSGRIVNAEALIRWQHPERGIVAPMEFIPLAEETGMIVPIGAWVIDAVCAQQAAWLEQQVDIVPVAVNLSAIQFKHGKVLQTIRDAISLHRLEQKYIEFELTESVMMDNPDEATRNLNAMKKLGMQLSLDDFGTGYSSLAYLKRFPFDFVKIDRTFITDVTNNPGDAAIATAVIAMSHSLNLRVVAEGVETEGQLQFLRKHRCDEMQGYYFSPPVPADAFVLMLREDKRLPRAQEPLENIKTLLIVDDEPHNLSALKRLLRQEGYRVLTANGGQEGLALLAVNPVQVIITDQRMPGMSGSEFLSIVKELYPDTIRIILSGYTDLAVVTESVNQGAVFKFLTKPWEDELLREHIRDAFRRYRPSV